jgi:hypothetical protein
MPLRKVSRWSDCTTSIRSWTLHATRKPRFIEQINNLNKANSILRNQAQLLAERFNQYWTRPCWCQESLIWIKNCSTWWNFSKEWQKNTREFSCLKETNGYKKQSNQRKSSQNSNWVTESVYWNSWTRVWLFCGKIKIIFWFLLGRLSSSSLF